MALAAAGACPEGHVRSFGKAFRAYLHILGARRCFISGTKGEAFEPKGVISPSLKLCVGLSKIFIVNLFHRSPLKNSMEDNSPNNIPRKQAGNYH